MKLKLLIAVSALCGFASVANADAGYSVNKSKTLARRLFVISRRENHVSSHPF